MLLSSSKRQADVASACLSLSYEVLLIDKNEFISVEVSITSERYAPPFLFAIRMYAYNLKVVVDSSLWWKIAWLFFFRLP